MGIWTVKYNGLFVMINIFSDTIFVKISVDIIPYWQPINFGQFCQKIHLLKAFLLTLFEVWSVELHSLKLKLWISKAFDIFIHAHN